MKRIVLLLTSIVIATYVTFSQNYNFDFNEVTKLKMSTKLSISQVWPRGYENGIMYAYIPPYYEGKVVFASPLKYQKRYMALIMVRL